MTVHPWTQHSFHSGAAYLSQARDPQGFRGPNHPQGLVHILPTPRERLSMEPPETKQYQEQRGPPKSTMFINMTQNLKQRNLLQNKPSREEMLYTIYTALDNLKIQVPATLLVQPELLKHLKLRGQQVTLTDLKWKMSIHGLRMGLTNQLLKLGQEKRLL